MADATQESLQDRDGQVEGKTETSHHPRTDSQRDDKWYYGIAPLKPAHWVWEIWLYFWLGGIGAGAHLASVAGQLLGWEDKAFFRASRYTVLVTMIISPVLLILDLGRPERFLNMLRILKLRSPMSLGSWALFVFGSFGGLIAASQAARDGLLGRNPLSRTFTMLVPERALSVLALPFALFVGAYGGILIAATSIPMWARNWFLMGPTFLASGVSTGLSMLSFILHLGEWGEERTLQALHRAERLVLLIEAGLMAASLIRMGRWGKPLRTKNLAPLFFGSTILGGILTPLLLLFGGKETRGKSLLSSVLVLLGGLAFRYAMVEGGRMSSQDPEAYFTFAQGENVPAGGQDLGVHPPPSHRS
jgi:formate-dependent nitrite reductase membrane component NrfD